VNAAVASFGEEGTLVLEQRFAIVPEWIIDRGHQRLRVPAVRGTAALRANSVVDIVPQPEPDPHTY